MWDTKAEFGVQAQDKGWCRCRRGQDAGTDGGCGMEAAQAGYGAHAGFGMQIWHARLGMQMQDLGCRCGMQDANARCKEWDAQGRMWDERFRCRAWNAGHRVQIQDLGCRCGMQDADVECRMQMQDAWRRMWDEECRCRTWGEGADEGFGMQESHRMLIQGMGVGCTSWRVQLWDRRDGMQNPGCRSGMQGAGAGFRMEMWGTNEAPGW